MKRSPHLLPQQMKMMRELGENLRLARLRRRLGARLVAERAGISRPTLHRIEQGSPSVAMGSYFAVLNALGLAGELPKLAADDELGRLLQDRDLPKRVHHRKATP